MLEEGNQEGEPEEEESDVVFYYESIKRNLNKRLILECQCDERLQAKTEESTRLAYTVW